MVIAHPGVFERKLLNWSGKLQDISIPLTREEMEKEFSLVLTKSPLEFVDGLVFSGEVKRFGFPQYTGGLFRIDGELPRITWRMMHHSTSRRDKEPLPSQVAVMRES